MKIFRIGALFLSLLIPGLALAEEDSVSSAPDVVAEGAAPVEVPKVEPWKAEAGFNGLINTGNSSSEMFGGMGLVSYKWDRNKVEAAGNGAYGRSEANGVKTTNTKNWKTSLRYDRYLTDPISLFALGHVGADQPAGFDLKYGTAGGFAHELVRKEPHFFKYEVGFDYTYEDRVTPPNEDIYSARTFLQYKYNINKLSVIGQDVEALFDFENGNNVRLNTLTSLTFKLTEILGFQAGYAIRFDNVPVPGFKKVDTTTQLGLVATFI